MRFSIRDILWLTIVAALIAGWWADKRFDARRALDLSADTESHSGYIAPAPPAWPPSGPIAREADAKRLWRDNLPHEYVGAVDAGRQCIICWELASDPIHDVPSPKKPLPTVESNSAKPVDIEVQRAWWKKHLESQGKP